MNKDGSMNVDDIRSLLCNEGESFTVEFKKSTGQLRAAAETLCAFLNGSGGTLLFGVTDAKQMIGQQVTDKTRRNIAVVIGQITPVPKIRCHYIEMESGRHIIALEVFPQPAHQPYTFNGKAYHRIESSTHVMPRDYYHYEFCDL